MHCDSTVKRKSEGELVIGKGGKREKEVSRWEKRCMKGGEEEEIREKKRRYRGEGKK